MPYRPCTASNNQGLLRILALLSNTFDAVTVLQLFWSASLWSNATTARTDEVVLTAAGHHDHAHQH